MTVYNVISTGNATTDGSTLRTTVLAGLSGDTVTVGSGTFALGNNTFLTPNGVSIVGSGIDTTTITSTRTNTCSMRIPSSATLQDFTLDISTIDGATRFGLGATAGVAAFTGSVVRRVKVKGDSDAIYNNRNNCSAVFDSCQFLSNFDGVSLIGSGGNFTFLDCIVTVTGPNNQGTTQSQGYLCPGTVNVRIQGGSVSCINGGVTDNSAISVYGANMSLYYVTISSSNGANPTQDFSQGNPGSIVAYGCSFNSANVIGTVTSRKTSPYRRLSRQNTSQLISPFQA